MAIIGYGWNYHDHNYFNIHNEQVFLLFLLMLIIVFPTIMAIIAVMAVMNDSPNCNGHGKYAHRRKLGIWAIFLHSKH